MSQSVLPESASLNCKRYFWSKKCLMAVSGEECDHFVCEECCGLGDTCCCCSWLWCNWWSWWSHQDCPVNCFGPWHQAASRSHWSSSSSCLVWDDHIEISRISAEIINFLFVAGYLFLFNLSQRVVIVSLGLERRNFSKFNRENYRSNCVLDIKLTTRTWRRLWAIN